MIGSKLMRIRDSKVKRGHFEATKTQKTSLFRESQISFAVFLKLICMLTFALKINLFVRNLVGT